jgi:hypothetical protein
MTFRQQSSVSIYNKKEEIKMQQISNLPVPANQVLQNQLMNLSLNNPPFVPNINTSLYNQELIQAFPYICAALALDIQNNASQHSLRAFLFNICSSNMYQNNEFVQIVAGYMDHVSSQMFMCKYNNLEQCIGNTMPMYTKLVAANYMRLYPELQNYIDQELFNQARQGIALFDNIAGEVRHWQQSKQQGNFNNGNNGGIIMSSHNVNRGTGMLPSNGMSNSMAQPFTGRTYGSDAPTGLFNNNNVQTGVNNQSESLRTYSAPSKASVVVEKLSGVPVPPVDLIPAPVKWYPSMTFPYMTAYNPTIQMLNMQLYPNGSVNPQIEIKQGNNQMKYEDHITELEAVFGPLAIGFDYSNSTALGELTVVNKQMSTQLDEISVTIEKDPNVLSGAISTYVNPMVITDASEENAWTIAAVERMLTVDDKGNLPIVYRRYAFISTVVVALTDHRDLINSLAVSKTYNELREKLKVAETEIPPQLFAAINNRMTVAINRIIAQNLAIPDLTIDSFVHDIDDLLKHLESAFGGYLTAVFIKHQGTEIANTFVPLTKEIIDGINGWYLENLDDPKNPTIHHLAKKYSLTYLNCRSHELELQLIPNIGNVLKEDLTPEIYNLVKNIFIDADLRGMLDARHLIRTNDDRIIEARVGYLDKDALVVTLID